MQADEITVSSWMHLALYTSRHHNKCTQTKQTTVFLAVVSTEIYIIPVDTAAEP